MTRHSTSFEYWDANGITYNIVAEDQAGFWVNHNKVCKTSLKLARYIENPVSPVKQCGRCGVWGSTKKVQDRWLLDTRCICMSCWNKVRPILKAEENLEECKKLANKLIREAQKCRKEQQTH